VFLNTVHVTGDFCPSRFPDLKTWDARIYYEYEMRASNWGGGENVFRWNFLVQIFVKFDSNLSEHCCENNTNYYYVTVFTKTKIVTTYFEGKI
jgi:hypothetical protein